MLPGEQSGCAGRARAGCRACCGRPPCASCGTRDFEPRPCGPGCRRSARPRAAAAPRARCRRRCGAGRRRCMLETMRNFGSSLPGGVEQREVLLVLPHGEDQALLRHFQERGIELADVDARVLDQRGDLVEQVLRTSPSARLLRAAPLPGAARSISARRAAKSAITMPSSRSLSSYSSALGERDLRRLPMKRWPRVRWPDSRPSTLPGTTRSPCSITSAVHGPHELRVAVAPAHHLRHRQ